MNIASRRNDKAAVIGAGMAGLSCAIALASRGVPVVLLEKENAPGGKMRRVRAGEALLDGGPTVFTMRWVFEKLFAEAGVSLAGSVGLKEANVLARHAWPGGARLDLFADRLESAQAIAAFAGKGEAEGYLRFCRDAGKIHDTLKDSFMAAQRPGPVELALRIGRTDPLGMFRLNPFSTLWSALGGYFKDQRLRQLFARYATYVGSSPFSAPATLMLIAHVEQEGVWLVDGGMHALALAMEDLARKIGVELRRGVAVRSIARSGGGFELRLSDEGAVRAASVVHCGDVSALAGGMLGDLVTGLKPVRPRDRSLSAIVWAMRGRAEGFPLSRHTVFFSDDYRAEFDAIFRHGEVPRSPTAYVCAQDRDDTGMAGVEGAERLYMLVNAPANGDMKTLSASEREQCLQNALKQLRDCGMTLEPQEEANATTPADWNRLFPGSGGA
ncbi:MAG: FAD-dependent oxidoreductase, partial [Nitratireductor sp.]|nr:FAD-dependent oxidoreductase [Nitratireductor sp.]